MTDAVTATSNPSPIARAVALAREAMSQGATRSLAARIATIDPSDPGQIADAAADAADTQLALVILADTHGLATREEGVVPWLAEWTAMDGVSDWPAGADYQADEDDLAADIDPDAWRSDDDTETEWIDVRWWLPVVRWDGVVDTVDYDRTFAIDPEVPGDCEHEWCSPHSVVGGCEENPGVWGSGAGVEITEICRYCGMYRITETHAQSRHDGQYRGVRVSYRQADEDSLAWIGDEDEEEEEAE
jgi:hypothetical protein